MSRNLFKTFACGASALAVVVGIGSPSFAQRIPLDSTSFASVGSFDTGDQGLLFALDLQANDGLHAWTILRGIPAGGSSFETFTAYDGTADGQARTRIVRLKRGTTAYLKVCDKTSESGPELNCSITQPFTA